MLCTSLCACGLPAELIACWIALVTQPGMLLAVDFSSVTLAAGNACLPAWRSALGA